MPGTRNVLERQAARVGLVRQVPETNGWAFLRHGIVLEGGVPWRSSKTQVIGFNGAPPICVRGKAAGFSCGAMVFIASLPD